MTDKLVRLLKVVQAVQAQPGITASELAQKCEVNVRTIFRDLDVLSLVTPITNEGKGTGYRFLGKFFLYPLDFTPEEARAIQLLPSILDEDQTPPGLATALDKILATHKKEKSSQNELIENIASIIQMGTPAYRQEIPNFLQPIIQAILDQRTLDTDYHSQWRNETSSRRIDPYYLVPRDQRFYLIGYCHLAQDVRTFRISRFIRVNVLEDAPFDKSGFQIKTYLRNTWSIEQGEKLIHFKVRFSADVARYIKEEELFVHPRMKDLPDGGLLFEVTVNNEKEFLRWVLQYGPEAEILEPLDVRDALRTQLDTWRRLYT
jgi:predicted DNA-binding transcriptional regulator YafY